MSKIVFLRSTLLRQAVPHWLSQTGWKPVLLSVEWSFYSFVQADAGVAPGQEEVGHTAMIGEQVPSDHAAAAQLALANDVVQLPGGGLEPVPQGIVRYASATLGGYVIGTATDVVLRYRWLRAADAGADPHVLNRVQRLPDDLLVQAQRASDRLAKPDFPTVMEERAKDSSACV
jgi:hypothetical protein